jgi:hypothetical protein
MNVYMRIWPYEIVVKIYRPDGYAGLLNQQKSPAYSRL